MLRPSASLSYTRLCHTYLYTNHHNLDIKGKEYGLICFDCHAHYFNLGTQQSWPCGLTQKGQDDHRDHAWEQWGFKIAYAPWRWGVIILCSLPLATSWWHICVLEECGHFIPKYPHHFSGIRRDLGMKDWPCIQSQLYQFPRFVNSLNISVFICKITIPWKDCCEFQKLAFKIYQLSCLRNQMNWSKPKMGANTEKKWNRGKKKTV